MLAMGSEMDKMVGVGLVWGATNALMRRGALLRDAASKSRPEPPLRSLALHQKLLGYVREWWDLLLTWQYSLPFLVNLSASAAFFHLLSGAPISVAVPVTNATTFAATAAAGALLGERVHVGRVVAGTAVIVLGVWICIT